MAVIDAAAAEADARAREELRTKFERTLFVDAGAGTGKTTAIVGRIVELVARGLIAMPELVAITFTEAAAAELRARIRGALEEATGDAARTAEERERCRKATGRIGEASIDTIHAFAGDLLRTYPLNAGLPPGFALLDPIEQTLDFDEHFRAWFDRLAAGPHRDWIRIAFLLGLGPDQLHTLASALQNNYELLAPDTAWPAPARADAVDAARSAAEAMAEALELSRRAPGGHPAIGWLASKSFAVQRLGDARTPEDALTALGRIAPWRRVPGSQTDWADRDDFRRLKECVEEAKTVAAECLEGHRQSVLAAVLAALRDFVLEYAAERKRLGRATFQDLLVWARDMLREDAEVRAATQHRWRRVFVDEFQDTDPLQAEIAFYLCASSPTSAAGDWRALDIEAGKLCLVGDPKQSIYRFRRADIALYQAVRDLVAQPLVLSRNFRSVPGVLEVVNRHFATAMTHAPGVQPEYQPLVADASDAGPCVWRFGGVFGERAGDAWAREADDVAAAVSRVITDGWAVSEGKGDARTTRKVRLDDICVLIPSRTNLRRLEAAFERRDIPYRVESGELLLATQEVRDLLSALRSVDDPSDQVALVAALRSPIYGCSDVELVRWVSGGGRLSYEYSPDGGEPRVATALADLASRHAARSGVTVAALVSGFIDDRMLVAAAFGDRRPREAWRRYRYVAARARAFAATGRTTLREFVEWMEGLARSGARDVSGSTAEMDEDAVRVMTVHGSKGLEFPVVILTGLGSAPRWQRPPLIADRVSGGVELRAKDSREQEWCTAGYESAAEAEKQLFTAESIRLAYVAATRARDHLLVSLYRSAKAPGDVPAAAFEATLAALGDEAIQELEGLESAPPLKGAGKGAADARDGGSPEASMRLEAEWVARRRTLLDGVAERPFVTATGLAHSGPGAAGAGDRDAEGGSGAVGEEGATDEPSSPRFRRGRAGTSVGRAVHAVLQTVDLVTGDEVESLAAAQAAAEGVAERAGDVARMVRNALASDPVRRAVASGRYWREVPFGAPSGSTVLEGFIDLLFLGPSGYEIVDYKTDDMSADEIDARMETYARQGEAYALLTQAVVDASPVSVHFVFAQRGLVVDLMREQV